MDGILKELFNNSKILNAVRYKITPFMIKKKRKGLFFDDSPFYRLNLNCRGDAYYGYVNIEDRRTKARVFVSAMYNLPFSDNTVKFIIADFGTMEGADVRLERVFKEWGRVMVPGAVLTLDNICINKQTLTLLKESGFEFISDDSKKLLPVAHFLYSPKGNFKEINTKNILDRINNKEEKIVIKSILEYMNPKDTFDFLCKIFSVLNKGRVLEIVVKNEVFKEDDRVFSFFDKANLSFFLTESGFRIERIENINGYIKAVVKKRESNPINISGAGKRKVCFIEQFLIFRYNHLGFDNDAISRACDELGLDSLLIEGMRNMDYEVLKKAILSHRPEYLIFRLKEILPFISYIKNDLKKIGTKVIFWFCDPELPEKKDLGGLIDVMFLSNRGQLYEYSEAYNIKRIYYMPQGYDYYALHRIDKLERYDIGFLGALSSAPLHKTRRELIEALKGRYNVKIKNNIRNNIAEFYSQSKTVFGASDFDYELYTSNRFFVALGCGACYITKKFKGIELLAENRKHILWFETREELFSILDYYLSHDSERERIRRSAEHLALEKHTYAHRIKNILDILDGKTDRFYGFL